MFSAFTKWQEHVQSLDTNLQHTEDRQWSILAIMLQAIVSTDFSGLFQIIAICSDVSIFRYVTSGCITECMAVSTTSCIPAICIVRVFEQHDCNGMVACCMVQACYLSAIQFSYTRTSCAPAGTVSGVPTRPLSKESLLCRCR